MTSANLDEILPRKVSRLMEHAQRQASLSIGRQYALWDSRTLDDAEPFSVAHEDASYINLDLFMSRFRDWGLPSKLLSKEIGGAVPHLPFRPWNFFKSIPVFLKMQRKIRKGITQTGPLLKAFEQEFDEILANPEDQEARLVNWFTRYYIFIVRQNMVVNACLSSAGGNFWGRGATVYKEMEAEERAHRLAYESDPATPRPHVSESKLRIPVDPPGIWSFFIRLLNRMGIPGLGGYYFQVREWFRDSNMRLFHRLHMAMGDSDWFAPHAGERTHSGTFWQDGGELVQQDFGFLIYPGEVEGTVGKDILVVDALEPGHFEQYKQAKAVISRTGGRLSHGATLLRELKKPSAISPDVPDWTGKNVRFKDGQLELLDVGV